MKKTKVPANVTGKRTSHWRAGLTFLFCTLLIFPGSLLSSIDRTFALSQGQRKSISKGVVVRNMDGDPVKIKEVKVGSAARRFEEEFEESDDWLKKLSLEIANDWNKPIVHLRVSLDFPETRSSGNLMSFQVYAGNRPGSPEKRTDIYIAPGEKIILDMADRYEWLTQFLNDRHSISQINKIEIRVELAVFDDKTAWGGGEFFVQDPNKPTRYINVGTKAPTR